MIRSNARQTTAHLANQGSDLAVLWRACDFGVAMPSLCLRASVRVLSSLRLGAPRCLLPDAPGPGLVPAGTRGVFALRFLILHMRDLGLLASARSVGSGCPQFG